MKRILSLAAVAFLGLAGTAHAALVDITLGSTSSNVSYSNSSASLSPNINLNTTTALTLNGAQVVSGSSSGQYAQPSGTIYGGTYLAVYGGTSASFSGPNGVAGFGFTWGSIDDYNSITLTDSRNVSYTITGADLLAQLSGPTAGTTQADVYFTDSFGTIVSAVLSSTSNSFEAANFQKTSAVPLPPALPLFAMALLAIGFMAYHKGSKAA